LTAAIGRVIALACTLYLSARMTTNLPREHQALLRDLELAVLRLAAAVESEPPIAAALRRFAGELPGGASPLPPVPPPLRRRRPDVRGTLYRALDAGAIDGHNFDWLMVAEGRARRARARRTTPVLGS